MRSLAIAFVLILSVSGAAAQSASAVIHPDSTPFTASGTDWLFAYSVFVKSCNTTTLKGTTGVSASTLTFTLSVSNSPAGCAHPFFGSCDWTTSTVTFTVTSSTASGGSGTLKFNTPLTETCAGGGCIYTIAPQTATGGASYTNATTSLVTNSTVTVARSGPVGGACGALTGSGSITFSVTVTPSTISIV